MTIESIELESAGPIEASKATLLGESLSSWREGTRMELHLPANGRAPVVGAGHQPGFWHPGVLAKFLHARHLAGADGALVHLVVDHDASDPGLVRVPVRRNGALAAETHRFGPSPRGAVAMSMPTFDPTPFDDGAKPALESIASGLERARAALARHRSMPNAAWQVAAAVSELSLRWLGAPRIVPSSRLLTTALGAALVEQMKRDPSRCAVAFNRALELEPRAAAPLRTGTNPELPLWLLDDEGGRRRVTVADLASRLNATKLLPRASLLSAILRLGICDRVVHGLGAKRYERVTDAWFRHWLGVELPPIDIASATLTLPLAERNSSWPNDATEADRRRAFWNPESLDSPEAAVVAASRHGSSSNGPGPRKRELLDEISRLPRRSGARRAAHRRLLDELEAMRSQRRERLRVLDAHVEAHRIHVAERAIASDRTWPFVYFEESELEALSSRLREAASAGASSGGASGSGR